jgi:hypothetical protein
MMDSSLPLDVCRTILDLLNVSDQINLSETSQAIRSLIEQTGIFEVYVKRKFPLPLLDISQYNNTWVKLFKDDNAKNGRYRLQMNHHPLEIKRIDHHHGNTTSFSAHKVRSIEWDQLSNQIILEVEAFGDDVVSRTASSSTTCIFRFIPHTPPLFFVQPDNLEPSRPKLERVAPVRVEEYKYNTASHQLFRLYFDAALFPPGYSYKYSYGERSVTILSRDHFPSLPELFDCRNKTQPGELWLQEVPIDGGPTSINMALLDMEALHDYACQPQPPGPCEFVSRSTPLEPSNVLEWERIRITLPRQIRERHCKGEWGAVQLPPPDMARGEDEC